MTATQAAPPRVQGQAAVPVGGDRAWPNNKPTHRATSATWHHWCGGRRRDLPRCRWAAARPGRASRQRAKPHVSDPAPLAWRAPEGSATVPVGGGRAWPGFETTRQATRQRPGTTGMEGAGGICRGAGGRRQGLADTTQHRRRRRCEGHRRDRRARAGFEARRRTK